MQKNLSKLGIPRRIHQQRLTKPPQNFPNKLHFSLTPEQTAALEDCLFFTASEVHPDPFRKKALALIEFIRSDARYQEMVFETEKSGGDCGCES